MDHTDIEINGSSIYDYRKNMTNTTICDILKLISRSNTRIDICSDYKMPKSLTIENKLFKNTLSNSKNSVGISPRYIIEVTKDNIDYCKELMEIVHLRHFDNLKGNFILNEKECVVIYTISNSKEEKTSVYPIHTSIKEIVEQQQYVFDTFWNNAIPINEKIKEMGGNYEGLSQPNNNIVKIIQDQSNIESLLITNIRNARTEVIFFVNSLNYLTYLFKIGLDESIKYANNKGSIIIILYPEDEDKEINNKNNLQLVSTIKNYAKIKSISRLNGSLLIVDNSKMITISDEGEKGVNANMHGVYTDNKFIVNNFGSLLDTLLNEREMLDSLIAAKEKLADSNKHLVESNEELWINSKNQKEFINIAAHELRTPIHAILGGLWLIENDPTRCMHHINIISRNANRLEKLVEDLLDTARIESDNLLLHKEKTDIKELISTTIQDVKIDLGVKIEKEVFEKNNNFYKKHEKTIDIILFPDEEHDNIYHPLYVMVDRSRITQVISNILSNSIKSIDNYDGNITIFISKRNKEKNSISQADEILVNIKDTGKGINPEIHSKLFEKFSTNSSSGIGLGLYITKNIIEAHGGSIWAESNPDGIGATFSFSLPSM